MNNTTTTKKNNIKVEWHFFDAKDKVLGRFASEVAQLLIGKHKVDYAPNLNVGDKVVVTNASQIAVTGKNKKRDKIYYRHTNYPGGVRSETLEELLERDSSEVIRRAVKGMLPKNKLQKIRMANLYIYDGEEHPHTAQQSK